MKMLRGFRVRGQRLGIRSRRFEEEENAVALKIGDTQIFGSRICPGRSVMIRSCDAGSMGIWGLGSGQELGIEDSRRRRTAVH